MHREARSLTAPEWFQPIVLHQEGWHYHQKGQRFRLANIYIKIKLETQQRL